MLDHQRPWSNLPRSILGFILVSAWFVSAFSRQGTFSCSSSSVSTFVFLLASLLTFLYFNSILLLGFPFFSFPLSLVCMFR